MKRVKSKIQKGRQGDPSMENRDKGDPSMRSAWACERHASQKMCGLHSVKICPVIFVKKPYAKLQQDKICLYSIIFYALIGILFFNIVERVIL